MHPVTTPRVCIVGESPGVGKSFFVTGLLMALKKRGMSVSCAVLGTALQQAVVYSRIIRRYVRCLDIDMIGYSGILDAVGHLSIGSEILIIDGTGGIFDGSSYDSRSPSTDLVCIQREEFPSILVCDVDRLTPSILARLYGFTSFPDGPGFDGVVFNKTHSPLAMEERSSFRELFSETGAPDFLGSIPNLNFSHELPQEDDYQAVNRTLISKKLLEIACQVVESHVDIDGVLAIADRAKCLESRESIPVVPRGVCRIAVADDSCFNVCFQDNLDYLRLAGADIVTFSPLVDTTLPTNTAAVYLPGGCLSEYAEVLEENVKLGHAIKEFVARGGVLFSEGAGTAVLSHTFQPKGTSRVFKGYGVIPLDVIEDRCNPSRGTIIIRDSCILGEPGMEFAGLCPSDWKVAPSSTTHSSVPCVLALENESGFTVQDGLSVTAQTCSTFNFLHFGSNPNAAKNLVSAALAFKAAPSSASEEQAVHDVHGE